MRHLTRGLAIVSLLLVLGASAASAQRPQTRKGFWIGIGAGWGSYGTAGDSVRSDRGRKDSYAQIVKLGGTINPQLLLGAEGVAAWTSGGFIAWNATLSAFYYPKPASGLFLNGGVGVTGVFDDIGPGVTLGAGYDIRIGTNVSITPIADWAWGKPESGTHHDFFNFAVGVTFH